MKNRLASLLAAAVPLAMLSVQTVCAMNNADLLKLKEAGLSDETILLSIASEPADYDTSPAALVALKEGGISEPIIQKLISLKSGSSAVAAAAQSASPTTSPAGVDDGSAAPTAPTPAAPAMAAASSVFDQEFPSIAPALIEPVAGQNYFTRYTLHEERNTYRTTNYARGTTVPINTPVKLLAMKNDELLLQRLDSGEQLTIDNIEKYSRKSVSEVARLLLAAEKTPLEKLPPEIVSAIRNGEMRIGMTKEQVLMARGYPPAHETPTVDGDRWVYWSSRFVKQTIVFGDNRLVEGRGIH